MDWRSVLEGLYRRNKITIDQLQNCVNEGLITQDEMDEIVRNN